MTTPQRIRAKKGRNKYRAEIRKGKRKPYYGTLGHKRPAPFERSADQWVTAGRKPGRDSQRQKAYNAEDRVRKWMIESGIVGEVYPDIADAARYIRDLMETDWFQRRWPAFRECVVEYMPGSSNCQAWTGMVDYRRWASIGRIEMSTWGLGIKPDKRGQITGGELILLHELAHCLTPNFGHNGHGRLWARTFLELVRFKMGDKVHAKLRGEFDRERVKYRPTRGSG